MSDLANEINETNAWLWRFVTFVTGVGCSVLFILALIKSFMLTAIIMFLGAIFGLSNFFDSVITKKLYDEDYKYNLALEKQYVTKKWDNLKW